MSKKPFSWSKFFKVCTVVLFIALIAIVCTNAITVVPYDRVYQSSPFIYKTSEHVVSSNHTEYIEFKGPDWQNFPHEQYMTYCAEDTSGVILVQSIKAFEKLPGYRITDIQFTPSTTIIIYDTVPCVTKLPTDTSSFKIQCYSSPNGDYLVCKILTEDFVETIDSIRTRFTLPILPPLSQHVRF